MVVQQFNHRPPQRPGDDDGHANVTAGERVTVMIDESLDGERLDKALGLALAAEIPGFSRTRARALIEAGLVTYAPDIREQAGATISDPSQRVKCGQIFATILPEPEPASPVAQAIPLAIVYEDEHVLVVDKPAGLVVHPAAGNPDRTLVNALLAHCGASLSGIGSVRRPGIVHRLDKDTSGLMVVAKTDVAHLSLAEQFAAHSLDRAYKAVVWGVPQPAEGEISGNIGRDPRHRQRMTVVAHGGKPALTRYKVLRRLGKKTGNKASAASVASMVECRLATGRTHQIRVHMAQIGHPLLGDGTYSKAGTGTAGTSTRRPHPAPRPAAAAAAAQALGRQALHAYRIGFFHPTRREKLAFESELPSDIKDLIFKLDNV